MARSNMRSIQTAPTTTDEARELAVTIENLLDLLNEHLKTRRPE
jgi:hypothetical protein